MIARRLHLGFTLVELAVACAAGAILIGAMLLVLTTILSDRQRLAAMQSSGGNDQSQLITLLRRDLASATQIESSSGTSLVIRTYNALQSDDFQPTNRLCTVTYRVLTQSRLHWLVREQQYTDEPVAPRPTRNLVCCQIRHIDVQRITQPTAIDSNPAGATANDAAKPPALSWTRTHVTLGFDNSAASIDFMTYLP